MNTQTASAPDRARKPYRTPVHYAEAEFSLDDFSSDEILQYVRHHNLIEDVVGGLGDLDTIDTLLMCGQRDAVLEIISQALTQTLGRNVRL